MPRVLVISHFFPPHGGGGVHRALAWARHLPSFGWDVTVLAAGPGGYWIEDASLLARVPAGTEVLRVDAATGVALWRRFVGARGGASGQGIRVDGPVKALARALVLPDSYRAWKGPAVRAGRERIARGGIDVVLSTSPPETAHLVGEALAAGSGLPWVADFRDPWVALHYRRPPTPLHAALHRRLERRVIAGAARVLCASETHASALTRDPAERDPTRIVFLPNGVELEAAPASAAAPGAPAAGPAQVVATGTLVEVPALDHFLDALARRRAAVPSLRERLQLVLAGPREARLDARVAALGLQDVVRFTGPLPHAEARALQRSAAVLLLVRNEGPGYEAMVPGKLYEYLDARRPLVAALGESEAARLVREAGGVVVPPDDGERALAAVLRALPGATHGTGAHDAGAPAPDLAAIARLLEGRSRRTLAGKLAAVLDSLVPAGR